MINMQWAQHAFQFGHTPDEGFIVSRGASPGVEMWISSMGVGLEAGRQASRQAGRQAGRADRQNITLAVCHGMCCANNVAKRPHYSSTPAIIVHQIFNM